MKLEDLRRRVQISTWIAFFVFVLVLSAYVIRLWIISDGRFADDGAVWGQFGDYVGGILNPLIAFLAFYWLTQSVLLQKQELAETKDALKDSADSQSKQVLLAARAAEINALSAMLASHNSDLSSYRKDAHFIASQLKQASSTNTAFMPSGKTLSYEKAIEEADVIDQRMQEAFHLRQQIVFKMDDLLKLQLRSLDTTSRDPR